MAPEVAGSNPVIHPNLPHHHSELSQPMLAFTNAKDFNSALAKLDAAAGKLAAGKTADAIQKLDDFQTSLTSLATAPKPKIDPAVAQELVAAAQDVISCIEAAGTQ